MDAGLHIATKYDLIDHFSVQALLIGKEHLLGVFEGSLRRKADISILLNCWRIYLRKSFRIVGIISVQPSSVHVS